MSQLNIHTSELQMEMTVCVRVRVCVCVRGVLCLVNNVCMCVTASFLNALYGEVKVWQDPNTTHTHPLHGGGDETIPKH